MWSLLGGLAFGGAMTAVSLLFGYPRYRHYTDLSQAGHALTGGEKVARIYASIFAFAFPPIGLVGAVGAIVSFMHR